MEFHIGLLVFGKSSISGGDDLSSSYSVSITGKLSVFFIVFPSKVKFAIPLTHIKIAKLIAVKINSVILYFLISQLSFTFFQLVL
tara:strand:+ start:263 stop:517 length:255 start_codon:yes stop_codon:yes gene_type:complete